MGSRGRRSFHIVLAGLTVTLAGAALAWACHPAANISLSPNVGEPGTQVMLSGRQFPPNEVVRITWDGPGGTELARATSSPSGTLSTTVTIPNAPASTYTVSASTAAGSTVNTFTIPGARPSPEENGSPAPAQDRQPAGSGTSDGSHSTSGVTSGGGSAETSGAPARERAVTRGGSGGAARATAGSGAEGTAKLPSGTTVFADSLDSPATEAGSRPGAKAAERSARTARAVAQSSATGDLWSGFRSGSASKGLGGASAGPVEEPGSVPLMSLALMALGLTAVVAGAGLAATRRRRTPARAGKGPGGV